MPVTVENRLFKDGIDKRAIRRLALALEKSWPDFPRKKFVKVGLKGLPDLELGPGETVALKKRQQFVSRSIRTLHTGRHEVDLLVAGISFEKLSFVLTPQPPAAPALS